MPAYLGEFEQLVLLAVLKLDEEATGLIGQPSLDRGTSER